MPYYFLIPIRGDAERGAGLLAKSGIQNLVELQHTSPEDTADDAPRLIARLRADDAESALNRVRAALSEQFTVEDPRQEPGSEDR